MTSFKWKSSQIVPQDYISSSSHFLAESFRLFSFNIFFCANITKIIFPEDLHKNVLGKPLTV